MEVVIAALIAGATAVLVALINKKANWAEKRADEIQEHLATNGSNETLGTLVEMVYADVHDTKNTVRRLEHKVDKHHAEPAGVAHGGL